METFSSLHQLLWLDLSENRIRSIQPGSFHGLRLQHLFLNGNRHIQLVPDSFRGLATSGLYLHDCALTDITPELLEPVSAGTGTSGTGLVNLWLNGNYLERLDRRLSPIFSRLSHLRLGGNPLHCNCQLRWILDDLLGDPDDDDADRDVSSTVFRGAEPPSCRTPSPLAGKTLDRVRRADLACRPPNFGDINVEFESTVTGRLSCSAAGDPAPTIYWISPSGRAVKYDPAGAGPSSPTLSSATLNSSSSTADRKRSLSNTGVLRIDAPTGYTVSPSDGGAGSSKKRTSQRTGRMYICVANNDAGNVTLTVNVTWPEVAPMTSSSQRPTARVDASPTRQLLPISVLSLDGGDGRVPVGDVNDNNIDDIRYTIISSHVDDDDGGGEVPEAADDRRPEMTSSGGREFTAAELIAAVVVTHLTTLALVGLVAIGVSSYCVRRRLRTSSGGQGQGRGGSNSADNHSQYSSRGVKLQSPCAAKRPTGALNGSSNGCVLATKTNGGGVMEFYRPTPVML